NKVSAPKAESADHKRAAEKAGNNKSDFSAHMKEKLAAADKKTAAKNAQSEPAAEKKKTDASKSDKPATEAASAELAPQTEQVAQVDEAAGDAQDLVLEIAKDQIDEKDSALSALMAQFITPAQETPSAKETKQETDLETELAAQIVIPSGNNVPVAMPLEQSALLQNEESAEEELSAPTDEELLLVTQQIGMAGTLSPQQKLSPAELAGQAVAAKTTAAEAQVNAPPPALQSLLLAKSSPDEAPAPSSVEILDLESLQSLNELAAEAPKPQDFASSLRAALGAQPASPLANMQVAQVSAPLQIDPQQQAQAAEELNERINLMLSKNLKQVDIRLDPPELGRLQIKLSMHNDNASVQFT
ncbi:MAG: flagellar hook-length control protein FliK, partial [Vibrionaceae bacterium]